MQLYHNPVSGHSHRVRLLLSLLDVPVELVLVNLAKGEHKTQKFLALNAFGQVPVLVDGTTVLADSNAILVYLAMKYPDEGWLPEDPVGAAQVQRWFSVAAGELAYGPAAARRIRLFSPNPVTEDVLGRSVRLLTLLDAELTGKDWLVAGRPTVADVSLYGYVARSPEGGVDLTEYPYLQAWLGRVEMLPRFVPFEKKGAGIDVPGGVHSRRSAEEVRT
ncbi:glutathione S-transferase family protein [Rhizobium sp. SIMBA_035]